jgi:hypothetical protein
MEKIYIFFINFKACPICENDFTLTSFDRTMTYDHDSLTDHMNKMHWELELLEERTVKRKKCAGTQLLIEYRFFTLFFFKSGVVKMSNHINREAWTWKSNRPSFWSCNILYVAIGAKWKDRVERKSLKIATMHLTSFFSSFGFLIIYFWNKGPNKIIQKSFLIF